MNQDSKPKPIVCSSPLADANAACEECGVFGAFTFGDRKLCVQCYSEKGSCCPEFGKDDLWADRATVENRNPGVTQQNGLDASSL